MPREIITVQVGQCGNQVRLLSFGESLVERDLFSVPALAFLLGPQYHLLMMFDGVKDERSYIGHSACRLNG